MLGNMLFVILTIFGGVEFYVIAVVVAAAVIAFSAKGNGRGPVRQILLSGVLSRTGEETVRPIIELECRDDGSVMLHRRGLEGMSASGAVSIAVNVKGFDVEIKERTVPGKPGDTQLVDTASFVLDFMGAERYFISYRAEDAGLFAATALHNRPGIRVVKRMQ